MVTSQQNISESLKDLAAQKEKEWRDVTELRVQSLEAAYAEKGKQLDSEKARFHKLKEDFKYNLKLLGERDQDLERYDARFAELKAALNSKNAEVSELRMKIDDHKTLMAQEAKTRTELQSHYQHRLREKQAEIEKHRCSKDCELQEERKEFEKFKRNLERQLNEVEEELDAQRRELSTGFEDALKRREHEYRLKADEMSAQILTHDIKAKFMEKELQMLKSTHEHTATEFQQVEVNHRELEKMLRVKEWEITDIKGTKDARIAELEASIVQQEKSAKRMLEDFERKHAELDRYGREKESALTTIKEAHALRERGSLDTIQSLQTKVETEQIELRRLQWSHEDMEKDKNMHIDKLETELHDLQERWDKQMSELSHKQVSQDLEVQAIHNNEDKLKSELTQRREDLQRYKKELSSAAEREAGLERSRAQLELDWQRRYDDVERTQYEKSEELVKNLTRARDDSMAKVKELDRDAEHQRHLLAAMKKDRDRALATLKHHGVEIDRNINISPEASDEVSNLKEQNASLRGIVKEMRLQMEDLGHTFSQQKQPKEGSITEDYVKALEKEIRELKKSHRQLELDDGAKIQSDQHRPEDLNKAIVAEMKDSGLVRSHIQSLNDTIGTLRGDKVGMIAQVRKHQARIQYLENMVDQLSKQPRQKQVEVDQLQYELGAVNRRHQAEVASLRQRISELELQLIETRKEADEYFKSNLERNMESTALSNEVSALKLDMAQKKSTITFGAQELMIQQLQDEILRQPASGIEGLIGQGETSGGRGMTTNATIEHLQTKLRSAAKHITQLAREKQQLIELGNRLRAEMSENKPASSASSRGKPSGLNISEPVRGKSTLHTRQSRLQPANDGRLQAKTVPVTDTSTSRHTESEVPWLIDPANILSQQVNNKLSQLERLQYELTKKELQYAQKYSQSPDKATVQSSAEFDDRPPSILKKSVSITPATYDTRPESSTEFMQTTLGSHRSVSPGPDMNLLMSLSSAGGESLQDVWKILDERQSPSLMTPRYPIDAQEKSDHIALGDPNQSVSSDDWAVKGHKTNMDVRTKPQKKLSSKFSTRRTPQKAKVRNYNWKPDNALR